MITPITPKQAKAQTGTHIPSQVIKAINGLIINNLHGKCSCFTQEQAITAIIQSSGTEPVDNRIMRTAIFEKKWLDFEPLYRRAGWKVEFDKPGYNETYDANWTFTAK